jgi:hypothetical protein
MVYLSVPARTHARLPPGRPSMTQPVDKNRLNTISSVFSPAVGTSRCMHAHARTHAHAGRQPSASRLTNLSEYHAVRLSLYGWIGRSRMHARTLVHRVSAILAVSSLSRIPYVLFFHAVGSFSILSARTRTHAHTRTHARTHARSARRSAPSYCG